MLILIITEDICLYRHNARRDSNEKNIVRYLERCGASVVQLDDPGICDLLVGFNSINILIEIKNEKGKLTPAQVKFFETWQGQKAVVRSIKDAKQVLRDIGMPVYTYRCEACKQETIIIHSLFDKPKTLCPRCDQEKLVRIIVSVPVVIYRGDGWAGKHD